MYFLRILYPEQNFEHAQNFSPSLTDVTNPVTDTSNNIRMNYEFYECVKDAN